MSSSSSRSMTVTQSSVSNAQCGNPMFLQWLEEWRDQCEQSQQLNLFHCYRRAAQQLALEPNPLEPKQLKRIKGIGETLVRKIEKRLEDHLKSGGTLESVYGNRLPEASSSAASQSTNVTTGSGTQESVEPKAKKARQPRPYIPNYRSGAYGILIGLHRLLDNGPPGIQVFTKSQIIAEAAAYSDASYIEAAANPSRGQYSITAWASMSQLIKKNLCGKQGNPPKFYLTAEGQELADKLWTQSIKFEQSQSTVETTGGSQGEAASVSADEQTASVKPSQSIRTYFQAPTDAASQDSAKPPEPLDCNRLKFWYISSHKGRVRSKDDADIQVEESTIELSYSFKIEYHVSQASHSDLLGVKKLSFLPDASGMLVAFLPDSRAPEMAPGISLTELASVTAITGSSSSSQSSRVKKPPIPPVSGKQQSQSREPPAPSSTLLADKYTADLEKVSAAYRPAPPPSFHANHQVPLISQSMLQEANSDPSTWKIWPDPPSQPPLATHWRGPAIELEAGTFDVVLILDNREVRSRTDRDFIQTELTRQGIKCEVRPLSVGDVTWVAKSKTQSQLSEIMLDTVLERKRLDDLAASIKDGRFREQKLRLASCHLNTVFYLIEDMIACPEVEEFGRDRFRTAVAMNQVLDGFKVKRTSNIDDSIGFFVMMTRFLERKYLTETLRAIPASLLDKETAAQFKSQVEQRDNCQYYITFDSYMELNTKSKTLTLQDVWFRQLMCIRGISAEKASTIVSRFPTPHSLISHLCGLSTKQERVSTLKALNGPVQRKNLGDALCKKIEDLLCSDVYTDSL